MCYITWFRCLLAVCTADGRVKLYCQPFSEFRAEWPEVCSICTLGLGACWLLCEAFFNFFFLPSKMGNWLKKLLSFLFLLYFTKDIPKLIFYQIYFVLTFCYQFSVLIAFLNLSSWFLKVMDISDMLFDYLAKVSFGESDFTPSKFSDVRFLIFLNFLPGLHLVLFM